MLKALGNIGIEWLWRVFQVACGTGEVPPDWQNGVVVPIFKKGDKNNYANYRCITLLSIPGKIYTKVVEARIRAVVEPMITDEQCGFHPNRGTTDQVFTLKQIFEKCMEYKIDLHISFIDLQKAYDVVPRNKLWYCLGEYGVNEELIRAIRSLY